MAPNFPGRNWMDKLKAFRYSDQRVTTGQHLGTGKILKVLVVGKHLNQRRRTLQVMAPYLEGLKYSKDFFVMGVVVVFSSTEGARMEGYWVNLTIW